MFQALFGLRALLPLIQAGALLAAGGAVGFWFGMGRDGSADRIVAATVLAIAATSVIILRYRSHVRQRWQAAMNAYAEREIARTNIRQISGRMRKAG
jgi:hypothetical protein